MLEKDVNENHFEVGKEIKNMIKKLGEIILKNLPTANKSFKEMEKNKSLNYSKIE